MSDYEKTLELLKSFGISYYEYPIDKGIKTIRITAENTGNIKGYSGFFTEFNFDNEDKFIDIGIWE